ncbi:hypothetical protein QOT17_002409 [Balamuthia mandrillaris]
MGGTQAKLKKVVEDPQNLYNLVDLFESYDKNGSKGIDKREFKHFAKDFLRQTTDTRGEDAEEILKSSDYETFEQNLFVKVDKDGDGLVTFEEFKQAIVSWHHEGTNKTEE